jgi:hypothetical protein
MQQKKPMTSGSQLVHPIRGGTYGLFLRHARIFTHQIRIFATLDRHQLVGHVATLEFWMDGVRHCLHVIDGSHRRFEPMKAAEMKHISGRGTEEFRLDDPCCTRMRSSPPRRAPSKELGEARRHLCDSTYRFLMQCSHEQLVDETTLRRTCEGLDIGIEVGDLRGRN